MVKIPQKTAGVIVAALTLGITGAACCTWFISSDRTWLDKGMKLQGAPAEQVTQVMGNPDEKHTQSEYASRRKDIVFSYNPDPPEQKDFDYVLEYRGGAARMILFFVKDETVLHVYSGQT